MWQTKYENTNSTQYIYVTHLSVKEEHLKKELFQKKEHQQTDCN